DNEDAALRVSEALGGSHVNKAGATAWTEFYRTTSPIPSEDFTNTGGELVLQVLSDGRQTVIPPTIHPDTNQPYRWTNAASLYDTPVEQLPELPADYRERILELGYLSGGTKKKTDAEEPSPAGSTQVRATDSDDSPFMELNRLAMENLTKWIPELGLQRCRRQRGKLSAYEAVPTWRPSHDRKPLLKSRITLKISHEHGSVDFSAHRKVYSRLA